MKVARDYAVIIGLLLLTSLAPASALGNPRAAMTSGIFIGALTVEIMTIADREGVVAGLKTVAYVIARFAVGSAIFWFMGWS